MDFLSTLIYCSCLLFLYRKTAIMANNVPTILAALFMSLSYVAKASSLLIIGRFIIGFSSGKEMRSHMDAWGFVKQVELRNTYISLDFSKVLHTERAKAQATQPGLRTGPLATSFAFSFTCFAHVSVSVNLEQVYYHCVTHAHREIC